MKRNGSAVEYRRAAEVSWSAQLFVQHRPQRISSLVEQVIIPICQIDLNMIFVTISCSSDSVYKNKGKS